MLHARDLSGLGRLTVDAVHGVTDLVEALHHAIVHLAAVRGAPDQDRMAGIPGMVYSSVRGITGLVGAGLDPLLSRFATTIEQQAPSPKREAMVSALNGLLGDHLAARSNPLAIPMQFRRNGLAVTPGDIGKALHQSRGRLVVLVHGLCMNDLQWLRHGHDHGAALARDLAFSPIYLHYNTGRHISENGKSLSDLLEVTLRGMNAQYPHPIELILLGHSMGGLVCRSACHYGAEDRRDWPQHLRTMMTLGTPHHGSLWEKSGNIVDTMLAISPYSAPFARLGKVRSSGITDLRYGHVVAEDWQGRDRFEASRDRRKTVPLPQGVACYAVAGLKANGSGTGIDQLVGDGLVSLDSALGRHPNPRLHLNFAEHHQWTARDVDHFDLLDNHSVYTTLKKWLTRLCAP